MSFQNRVQELKEMVRSSPYRCPIDQSTHSSSKLHPSCGDEVAFSARVVDGKVVEISVQGSGCLLSQAAGIIAARYAHNRLRAELLQLTDDSIIEQLGIGPIGPTRRQCITIVTEALKILAL